MITREQVADLQPGDVVELSRANGLTAKATGAVVELNRRLYVGPFMVRWQDGTVPVDLNQLNLTVVSRAPRPLYVNSDRTEPVPGDVVNFRSRSTGSTIGPFLYTYVERWAGDPDAGGLTRWVGLPGCHPDTGPLYNAGKLRLLVDGTTGQVVPS